MKAIKHLIIALLFTSVMLPVVVQAAGANWKLGRIYYRMVCTACHMTQAGGSISPATMKIAEWESYLDADKHAKGKDTVSYYVSKEYRESIKATNKAAAKFIKLPNEKLLADLRAFVIHGAKDSDTPARCN